MEPEDFKGTVVAQAKDGFRIIRLMPGFQVLKGRKEIATTSLWTEAVAVVLVEREAGHVR